MIHTPGPWTYIQAMRPNGSERSIDCAVLDSEGHVIAEAFQYVGRTREGRFVERPSLANARLMAAAPELLEALENLYAVVRGECPSILEDNHHNELVRSALAKAGGQP